MRKKCKKFHITFKIEGISFILKREGISYRDLESFEYIAL